MYRQISCSLRGVFGAEIDMIDPHDVEAGLFTVSRVLFTCFFACRWSEARLILLCTRFIKHPF